MTRENAKAILKSWTLTRNCASDAIALDMAIEVFEDIKALSEDMRIAQKGIANEKVLIGFNMAIALCNKHLGRGE